MTTRHFFSTFPPNSFDFLIFIYFALSCYIHRPTWGHLHSISRPQQAKQHFDNSICDSTAIAVHQQFKSIHSARTDRVQWSTPRGQHRRGHIVLSHVTFATHWNIRYAVGDGTIFRMASSGHVIHVSPPLFNAAHHVPVCYKSSTFLPTNRPERRRCYRRSSPPLFFFFFG